MQLTRGDTRAEFQPTITGNFARNVPGGEKKLGYVRREDCIELSNVLLPGRPVDADTCL